MEASKANQPEEIEVRKAWYAVMTEAERSPTPVRIEDALLDHFETSDPNFKVTVVNVQEITYRRLLEVAGAAIRNADPQTLPKPVSAPLVIDPTSDTPEGLEDAQEAVQELLDAYAEWLPRWQDQEAMTKFVICMERFKALVD